MALADAGPLLALLIREGACVGQVRMNPAIFAIGPERRFPSSRAPQGAAGGISVAMWDTLRQAPSCNT